jgi:hypothetical protein
LLKDDVAGRHVSANAALERCLTEGDGDFASAFTGSLAITGLARRGTGTRIVAAVADIAIADIAVIERCGSTSPAGNPSAAKSNEWSAA